MSKIVSVKNKIKSPLLTDGFSVQVSTSGVPKKFTFTTHAFLHLLETLDNSFSDFKNPAGRLIDQIEGVLPIKKDIKESIERQIRTINA